MARKPRFSESQILDAAAIIVAEKGPKATTIGAIAALLDAPSGSIYHRFSTRDLLLGRLWLNTAARFQNAFADALAGSNAYAAGLAAALFLPEWVRSDLPGAQIMLVHRREDFLSDGWPLELKEEAVRLGQQLEHWMNVIAQRLFAGATPQQRRLASFAIIDIPYAAVRRYVVAGTAPPSYVDGLIATAYAALIHPEAP
jgi:AcrR family transcriptional regulator